MVTQANTKSRKHFLTQRNAPYIFLLPMVLLYGVFKIYGLSLFGVGEWVGGVVVLVG